VPVGNGELVVITIAGLTVMAKAFVAVARLLSVTWTVKLEVVAALGWPLIRPVVID
jgi:hypothetical protein